MAGQILFLNKRYGRSRVYHPANGCYVPIDDLQQWQRDGVGFAVMDVETGTDVTRVLLVSPAPSGQTETLPSPRGTDPQLFHIVSTAGAQRFQQDANRRRA